MALPSSGTISMDMIRQELGIPSQAPFSLDTARSGGYVPLNPYSPSKPPSSGTVSLASWYSYCHTCTPIYSHTIHQVSFHPGSRGWASSSDACNGARTSSTTVYSSSSVLVAGSTLYVLSGSEYVPFVVSSPQSYGFWFYYGSEDAAIRMTDGVNTIAEVAACLTPVYLQLSYQYPGNGGSAFVDYMVQAYDGNNNPISVDTTITVNLIAQGDVSGTTYFSDTISAGTSSTGWKTATTDEPLDQSVTVQWGSVSPGQSSSQVYYTT